MKIFFHLRKWNNYGRRAQRGSAAETLKEARRPKRSKSFDSKQGTEPQLWGSVPYSEIDNLLIFKEGIENSQFLTDRGKRVEK